MKVFKKIISIILIFTFLFTSTFQGLSFSQDTGAQEASSESPPQTTTDTPADSGVQESQSPAVPAEPSEKPGDGGAATGGRDGGGYIPSLQVTGTGFNLAALQSFQTDPFTGRATFSVPIAVPQGRKGIQPNLALSYASGLGNSIVGVGWSLELGAIERSTKKGPPKYDSSDTFIFNSGGSSAELVNIGGDEYRAKIEGAFMKFIFNGTFWVVTDKSGTKYYFGQTSDSRQEESGKVFKWCLDKVIDRNDNYLTITYFKDINQVYPENIQWTGNEATPLQPTFKVEFVYETRSDALASYRSNFKVVTAKRLVDIKVKFNNELIRKYHLEYTTLNPNHSLLTSVTNYGADDTSTLPPITFEYKPQNTGWSLTGNQLPNATEFAIYTRVLDVNNDGFADSPLFVFKAPVAEPLPC